MRTWKPALVLAFALMNAGCMTTQLRNRMTEQASTIPDVYYQIVLNNLAMIAADPARMPYFSDPQTARTSIGRNASVSYGINLDLITSAPTNAALSYFFGRYLVDKQTATLTGGQNDIGEWAAVTANDPDKLFSMRAVYRKTTGTATSEDEEILKEFYYRHFEITDDTLTLLREKRPEVYNVIGEKLRKLEDIEYLSVESFERRLAADDILGKDDAERYRRAILKYARMEHEATEFVSDFDTHHLLYISALKPGWFNVGQRRDVPKNARYVGHYCDTYVWVAPENGELLTRHTLAILDIHTFRRERIGGTRVQPGLIPRF